MRRLSPMGFREPSGMAPAIEAFAAAAAARRPGAADPLAVRVERVRAAGAATAYGRLAIEPRGAPAEAGRDRLLAGMYARIHTRLRRRRAAMALMPHPPGTSTAEHGGGAAVAMGCAPRAGPRHRASRRPARANAVGGGRADQDRR